MNVARMLVVYLKRAGGQSQYSTLLAAQVQSESETFDSLDRWIAEHLKDDLRVGALAEQVHMGPRNLARAYAEQMRCSFIRILGIPPREYRKRFATTV
jgi:transcriptional regulator GlxA family with amidase domain